TMATAIITAIPGIFGYLVWELKENWKLYAANRPEQLGPVVVGSHGETLPRLLRPGFHSGTLPKLFRKLRRVERKAHHTADWKAARKYREKLHHVEEEIQHFAERQLVGFLRESKCFQHAEIEVAAVRLGVKRIQVELRRKGIPEPPLRISWEEHCGILVAGIDQSGWLDAAPKPARRAFREALAGFYKSSGVDVVREQLEAQWKDAEQPLHAFREEGLVVWTDDGFQSPAVYDLSQLPDRIPRPQVRAGSFAPVLAAEDVCLDNHPVKWSDWVDLWERDQQGECESAGCLDSVRLLPA
ncbi:MAG: hypothetical protein N2C14_26430, partial [Planctomycetales bacterium]